MYRSIALLITFALLGVAAWAQNTPEVLRPPKGSQVAIVVFEDLQCPDCRRAAPLLAEAGRTYKIPVVRHDYPLPMHNWSMQAAVFARKSSSDKLLNCSSNSLIRRTIGIRRFNSR